MKEVKNVLRIFREAKTAIEAGDSLEVKKLSGQTIHTAAISQDGDNVIVAVLIYSLAKIIEREHYREMRGWKKFYADLLKGLDCAIGALEKGKIEEYRDCVGGIRDAMNHISGDLRDYIRDVFRKAKVNKAFKIYEHGLSSGQTAKLLDVSLWELSGYIGQSSISEAKVSMSMPVKERLKIVEGMFK